jgi:hypothetical protein
MSLEHRLHKLEARVQAGATPPGPRPWRLPGHVAARIRLKIGESLDAQWHLGHLGADPPDRGYPNADRRRSGRR